MGWFLRPHIYDSTVINIGKKFFSVIYVFPLWSWALRMRSSSALLSQCAASHTSSRCQCHTESSWALMMRSIIAGRVEPCHTAASNPIMPYSSERQRHVTVVPVNHFKLTNTRRNRADSHNHTFIRDKTPRLLLTAVRRLMCGLYVFNNSISSSLWGQMMFIYPGIQFYTSTLLEIKKELNGFSYKHLVQLPEKWLNL